MLRSISPLFRFFAVRLFRSHCRKFCAAPAMVEPQTQIKFWIRERKKPVMFTKFKYGVGIRTRSFQPTTFRLAKCISVGRVHFKPFPLAFVPPPQSDFPYTHTSLRSCTWRVLESAFYCQTVEISIPRTRHYCSGSVIKKPILVLGKCDP